ncbi:Adhesion G-protein coupled receptor [Trichinella pseudospiralis]
MCILLRPRKRTIRKLSTNFVLLSALSKSLMLNIDCVVGVDGESAFCFVPAKQAYVDQESDKRRGGSRLCLLLKVAEGNLQQS